MLKRREVTDIFDGFLLVSDVIQRTLFVSHSGEKNFQIAQKTASMFIVIKRQIRFSLFSLSRSPLVSDTHRLPFSLAKKNRKRVQTARKPVRKHFTQIKKVQQRASLTLRYAQARGISTFQLNREFKLLTTLTAIEKKSCIVLNEWKIECN